MLVDIPDQRLLQGVAGTLRFTKLDGDGNPTAPTGEMTVGITRADGTVVDTDDLEVAISESATGLCTATLAPSEATLDLLTCTWTDAGDGSSRSTIVEIVGGFLFSIAQARNSHKTFATDQFDDDDLVAARLAVEWECEQIAGRAFVERYRRVTVSGDGLPRLWVPDFAVRQVLAATIGTTDLNADALDALTCGDQSIDRDLLNIWIEGIRNVVVAYTHGWTSPPPELRDAALLRLREYVNREKSGIPLRAQTLRTDQGTSYDLAKPSSRRTGIPEVDAVYLRYSTQADDTGNADGPRAYGRQMDFDPQYDSMFHGGRT